MDGGGEELAECRNAPAKEEREHERTRDKKRVKDEGARAGDWQTGFEIGKTVREVA